MNWPKNLLPGKTFVELKIEHPKYGFLTLDKYQRDTEYLENLVGGEKHKWFGEEYTVVDCQFFNGGPKYISFYAIILDWQGN